MYSEIFLKNSIKLLRSPFPVTLLTFLLEEHSKGTWTLKHSNGTQRALERHSKGTWALKTLGHIVHLGTRALEGHLGTQALGHLRTRDTQGTLFGRINVLESINYYIPA